MWSFALLTGCTMVLVLLPRGLCCGNNKGIDKNRERIDQLMKENRKNRERIDQLIEENRKMAIKMAEQYDKMMGFHLEELCSRICVKQWASWTACTKPCGGGQRTRTRATDLPGQCKWLHNFKCPHHTKEQEMCNRGCPNGGSPIGVGCNCMPGWNGTCCTTEIRCNYPGKPTNGRVFGTWPTRYGGVATFSCEDGYYLKNAETAICLKSGNWSSSVPECLRIKCERPAQGNRLIILNPQGEYSYGRQVVYACEEGYVLAGPEVQTCVKDVGVTGRWTGFRPRCKAVHCGEPGFPDHGQRTGTSFRYPAEVTYTCDPGYRLLGSGKLKCLANGRWLGTKPQCVQITCDPPIIPKFATARIRSKSRLGSLVTFTCDPGYVMDGNATLRCRADGNWDSMEPTCKASRCGDPGIPDNGNKDGSVYYYPYNVSYTCQNGYVLQGARRISCQANGRWNAARPVCQPCPQGSYMERYEKPGQCQSCPRNMNTSVAGANSKRLCTCVKGYTGPAGGPCTEVKCPRLYAPQNGTVGNCSDTMGSTCEFICQEGFVMASGSELLTCQQNGQWDGVEPTCSACQLNTYKWDERSCMPCPRNSHTNGVGNTLKGCMCDDGFEGPAGGPCNDTNECEPAAGRSPCEDTCENLVGSYKCGCSIPGMKIDEDDRHKCIVENQCKNLTREDAPANGGLVCHYYRKHASIQCAARCNPQFEFPSGVNSYETCGPTTGFTWSFRSANKDAVIPSCIPEYFAGIRLESDVFYFTRACDQLTQQEKQEVYNNFKVILDKAHVCQMRQKKVCNIQDMGIICGRNVTRTKRGVLEQVSQANIAFNLSSLTIGEDPKKDCPQICAFLRMARAICSPSLCISAYKRYLKAAILYGRRQLQDIYKHRLRFEAANRTFEPRDRVRSKQIELQCAPGMKGNVKDSWCVPCQAGTKWDPVTKDCVPCPPGTFQPFKNQTACIPCPIGSTSKANGSLICTVCEIGSYGDQCAQQCQCQHGDCDPRDGTCTCQTGWQGALCDEDIPGCRGVSCFPGVECKDVPAPGTGFTCGSCPPGYSGDGSKCTFFGTANSTEFTFNQFSTGSTTVS